MEAASNVITKIIFVIAVEDPDAQLVSWLAASMLAARRHNPDAEIVLVSDTQTPRSGLMARAVGIPDRFICLPTLANASPRHRSRHIKSQLRMVESGELLFLDADALCMDCLSPMKAESADIVAIPDETVDLARVHSWMRPAFERLDWKVPDDCYLSSGVFFLADTPAAYAFGETWHRYWTEWRKIDKSGFAADQPSFNAAILDARLRVGRQHERFNRVVKNPLSRYRNPAVLHFPASLTVSRFSLLHRLGEWWRMHDGLATELMDSARQHQKAFCGLRLSAAVDVAALTLGRWRHRRKVRSLPPAERSGHRV